MPVFSVAFFNWSIVDVQCCVSFSCTAKWSCCCQVTSVVSNSVWPHRQQPTRLLCPWDSPGYIYIYIYIYIYMYKVKVKVLVVQSCPTLCNPMDCSPPTFSGILQARILEWVSIPFSRGSSQPRVRTQVSCIAGGFFTISVTRETLKKGIYIYIHIYIHTYTLF